LGTTEGCGRERGEKRREALIKTSLQKPRGTPAARRKKGENERNIVCKNTGENIHPRTNGNVTSQKATKTKQGKTHRKHSPQEQQYQKKTRSKKKNKKETPNNTGGSEGGKSDTHPILEIACGPTTGCLPEWGRAAKRKKKQTGKGEKKPTRG